MTDGHVAAARSALAAGESVTLSVRAHPGAAKTRFRSVMADGTWKIDLAAAPEDGKANEELVTFLSETLSVPRACVEIVVGQTGRKKVVRVRPG